MGGKRGIEVVHVFKISSSHYLIHMKNVHLSFPIGWYDKMSAQHPLAYKDLQIFKRSISGISAGYSFLLGQSFGLKTLRKHLLINNDGNANCYC